MMRSFVALLVLGVLAVPTVARAQDRFVFEVRGGATTARESFLTTDLDTGGGLEATLSVRVAPGVFVYGGWDWQHQPAATPIFGTGTDVEDTGYAVGLRYVAPVPSPIKPWVRAGAIFNHVEIEDTAGALVADSEHTAGWELGGGIEIALGDTVSLTPGLRYRRFEPDVRVGSTVVPAVLSYIAYDVGLAWRF